MGIGEGNIVLWTSRAPVVTEAWLRHLFDRLGVTTVTSVYRWERRDLYEAMAEVVIDADALPDDVPASLGSPLPISPPPEQYGPWELGEYIQSAWERDISVVELVAAFDETALLKINVRTQDDLAMGDRITEQIVAADPIAGGGFRPGSVSVVLGTHLMTDWCNDEAPVVGGVAEFAVNIFGHGRPTSRAGRYRELLAGLPEIAEMRERLRPAVGPVNVFAMWEAL